MKRIGLLHITQVLIPREFLDGIYHEFRQTGTQGYERVALLAGKKEEEIFRVTHLMYPKQKLFRTETGVGFFVEGEELDRISDWLFENNCSLIAQLHSHPSEAYHSEADDDLAIMTVTGGLSIVIPYYGKADKNLEKSAFFRLLPGTGWTLLPEEEIKTLIKIID